LRLQRSVEHLVAQPCEITGFDREIRTATPDLGEHSDAILQSGLWTGRDRNAEGGTSGGGASAALVATRREERIGRLTPQAETHAAAIVGKKNFDIVLPGRRISCSLASSAASARLRSVTAATLTPTISPLGLRSE
jgi:hypothetical protein